MKRFFSITGFIAVSFVVVLWVTAWDLVLNLLKVVPYPVMLCEANRRFTSTWSLSAVSAGIILNIPVQLSRYGLDFMFRWQTYSGMFVVGFSALPTGFTLKLAAALVTGATQNQSAQMWALWLLGVAWVCVAIVTKCLVWRYWWKYLVQPVLFPSPTPI